MQLFVQRKEAFTENLCVTELIESHRGGSDANIS
jgi:hypothetical protein